MLLLKRIAIFFLLLTLIATATSNAEATSTPTPQAGTEVTFKGENNLMIPGIFYPAPQSPAPTVLLLNFRHRWGDWASTWSTRGFNVVAIDELIYNTGGLLDDMNKQDAQDTLLVIDQLNENPAVVPHEFAIVGGSLMGGYALESCAKSPDCRTAILLSPTDTAIDIPDPMATFGKRPILIVASKGERGIVEVAQDFDQHAQGEHRLILYDWGYHAMSMFYAHPELVDIVGDWFVKYVPDDEQPTQVATP